MRIIDGGLFVAFEGGEGTGKTSQSRVLLNWLLFDCGYQAMLTHEPGATQAGRDIRQILLDPHNGDLDPRAEALLYAADRAQHVETVIRPAMQQGLIVITDRYADSNIAYQGAARRLGLGWIEKVSNWASGGLWPDITFLLDLDPIRARARRRAEPDRIEAEPLEFHEVVRGAFLGLAASAQHRYLVVDAAPDEGEVTKRVLARMADMLEACAAQGRVRDETEKREEAGDGLERR